MSLSKHQIFASNDLKEEFVDIPEWGGKIKIKTFSAREQLDLLDFLEKKPTELDMAIQFILLGCVDSDNKKLFNIDDVHLLKEKNAANLIKLAKRISDLNKQGADDVDNLAKN